MAKQTKERWQELCEQAKFEDEPRELWEVCQEINRVLQQKETRLKTLVRPDATPSTSSRPPQEAPPRKRA